MVLEPGLHREGRRGHRAGRATPERGSYAEVVLHQGLRQALARLNPTLPAEALDDVFRLLTRLEGPTPEARNRAFYRMLVDGVTVEYHKPSDTIAESPTKTISVFHDPEDLACASLVVRALVETVAHAKDQVEGGARAANSSTGCCKLFKNTITVSVNRC